MKTSLILSVAVVLIAISSSAIGQSEESDRTIATSGDAMVYVVPDEAVVTFGVQVADPELGRAKSECESYSVKLSEAVKAFDIEQRHFATDNIEVSLRYDNGSNYTTVTAYVVRRMYMVTLKDIAKLEPLIDSVLTNGANVFEGVQFRSTEMRKHRDSARKMAIKAAREKAVDLAAALDCGIGAPRTITESQNYWGMAQTSRGIPHMMQNVAQEIPSGATIEGEALPLGQIGIKATVNVTFDLLPRAAQHEPGNEP